MAYINQIKVGNVTYDLAASSVSGGIALATCDTAAATAAKVATVTSSSSFSLVKGVIVAVKFSVTNTASNCTLNVNNTGAKSIYYNTAVYTSTGSEICGNANRWTYYLYDGTYWVWYGSSVDANTTYATYSLGIGYGTCATAAATAAKVVTLSNYVLATGGIVAVKFTYAVPANATMNINSRGAKAIYYNGTAITSGVIRAGDIATFIYTGSVYELLAISRVAASPTVTQSEIIGRAGTGTSGADNPTILQFSFAPSVIIYLGYVLASSGRYYATTDGSNSVLTHLLTSTPTKSITGLTDGALTSLYSYKSDDGKTYYQYNTASSGAVSGQLNTSGRTYYFLALS